MTPPSQISNLRHQNSSNDNMSQQQEDCTNTRKIGRGKTTGLGVSKKKKKSATGKLKVYIPTDKMVAVGPGASDFITEISTIVQKHAPLNVEKWKEISDGAKEKIITKVLDTFEIEFTDHNRDVILEAAQRLYRSHRTRLRQHFQIYETNEQALENKPDEVSEEDWVYLVNYFSTPKFKAMSERNKKNKAKQVINHICGRKSFQAVSYDARDPETQKEPNFQRLWRITHMKNNGAWVDEASREVDIRVQEVSTEMLQDVDEEADKDSIVNVAFKSVVGERSGYSRGLGAGIKPTKGKSAIRLQQELANEREKRQNIEMKLKEVEAQLQEERNIRQEMAARFEESQRQFEERMDKQLEERLAAVFARMQTSFLVGQSSSAMNMASDSDHRVETTNTLIARKPSASVSATSRGGIQSKVRPRNVM